MNIKKSIVGLFWLGLGILLIFHLNKSHKIGGKPIPAFGPLLNPYYGVWLNGEGPFEDISFENEEVSESVNISFDQDMVPHIYASNLKDALFAQGYVEAYHRLFQMDLSTRAADGKLAEILGENLYKYDLTQRRLGMGYAADNAIQAWSQFPGKIKLLDAYTAGINHYIKNLNKKDWPMEYKLVGFEPTEWSNRRSALLLKAMSQTLCGYEEDVANSNALAYFGENFTEIYPERNPKDIPIISEEMQNPAGTIYQNEIGISEVISEYFIDITRPRSPDGVGSNNWAISSIKSTTGNPILANDPHLKLTLPSVWYEVHITTPQFSSRGASLLGMPGIMIGFNENIAWGETNVGHDVMDYYKINWSNDEKTKYWYDGKELNVTYRVEEIKVRGKKTRIDSVKYTVWGPLTNPDQDLALRWVAHDKSGKPEFETFVLAMTSHNYELFLDATDNFYAPAQNFVFAEKDGGIGLRVNGNLPKKTNQMGRFIQRGDTSASAWKGFIPRNENPQAWSPDQGYVASANQWSAPAHYPYYYNGSFEPFRGRRLNTLLRDTSLMGIEDMKNIQNDNFHMMASEVLPHILSKLDNKYRDNILARELQKWDYNVTTNSQGPYIFQEWFNLIHRTIWDEVYQAKTDKELPEPDIWHTANLITDDQGNKFFNIQSTDEQEGFEEIVNLTFEQVMDSLANKQGLTWGENRKSAIEHLLRIPAFSILNLELNGFKHSLNAQQDKFGPSWRMIVELGKKPIAYGIYPGGQSGNPASQYYSNRVEKWSKGEYNILTLPKSPQDLEKILFTIKITSE